MAAPDLIGQLPAYAEPVCFSNFTFPRGASGGESLLSAPPDSARRDTALDLLALDLLIVRVHVEPIALRVRIQANVQIETVRPR